MDDLDRTIALYNDALRYIQAGGEDSWGALLGLADAWVEIELIRSGEER